MDSLLQKLFLYIIIILSATFHEYAHGWAAHRLGDDTAKNAGRLTLNPLKHIDLLGTVIIPLILLLSPAGIFIGWAKPVPYNPYNLRDQKYGSLKVGIAGPAANLLIALILGLILRFSLSTALLATASQSAFLGLLGIIAYINIFLALFNLLPFPPLDGSKVLIDLLPGYRHLIEGLSFVGILLALFFSYYILSPITQFIFHIITGQGF